MSLSYHLLATLAKGVAFISRFKKREYSATLIKMQEKNHPAKAGQFFYIKRSLN